MIRRPLGTGTVEEVRAKTPHGEITIDQMAAIQPGMAAIMKDVGERYTRTYYAAKGGNWKLAAYELNLVRNAFKTAKVTRPKFADDLTAFDAEFLNPIFNAIHKRDWNEFEAAFEKGEFASDTYHDKRGYPHVRYQLPEDPPTSNLYQGPPENFKRKSRSGK